MHAFQSFFLRSKHATIFFLLFAPYALSFVSLIYSFQPRSQGFVLFALSMAVLAFVGVSWAWSAGIFLNSVLPLELKRKTGFFSFALIYPFVYGVVFVKNFILANPPRNPTVLGLIALQHLFGMFCTIYVIYFVSKSLALAESGHSVSFYEFAGPFFLLFFFPIGIWLIQPRINDLYAKWEQGSVKTPDPSPVV
jgi:hypothetical protein